MGAPDSRNCESGLKQSSRAVPPRGTPVSSVYRKLPLKPSSTWMRPSTAAASSVWSGLKRTMPKGTGLLASAGTCGRQSGVAMRH